MPAKQHSSGNGADPRRAQPGSPETRQAGHSSRAGQSSRAGKPQEAWKEAELHLPEAEDKAAPSVHVADAGDAAGWVPSATGEETTERADPPQPRPRDYGETIRTTVKYVPASEAGGGQTMAESDAKQGDDGTGGETWNRALGNNTNAGMIRFFGAVALFILICASVFWLAAD
ncbi:hypothetical protein PZN02_005698 [Sinorhizobium garamanticum]|uniref:Transmembrane protein n=1 Tax=Sinorhizobium garamanticum TaxID=680247 RepID=A0ABY8DLC8_9HYPH|nr:hypothetical protein [Sinorhizobium garamanticum]WEX90325.1 hypothetical protein PZN02_005698 [Sinorhizobium garamanticum]